jgi:hypothetical protein
MHRYHLSGTSSSLTGSPVGRHSSIKAYVSRPAAMYERSSSTDEKLKKGASAPNYSAAASSTSSPTSIIVLLPSSEAGWNSNICRLFADEIAFHSRFIVVVPDTSIACDPTNTIFAPHSKRSPLVDQVSLSDNTHTFDCVISALDYVASYYDHPVISIAGLSMGASLAIEVACRFCELKVQHVLRNLRRNDLGTINSVDPIEVILDNLSNMTVIQRKTIRKVVAMISPGASASLSIDAEKISLSDSESSAPETSTPETATSSEIRYETLSASSESDVSSLEADLRWLKQLTSDGPLDASSNKSCFESLSFATLQQLSPMAVVAISPENIEAERVLKHLRLPLFIAGAYEGDGDSSFDASTQSTSRYACCSSTDYGIAGYWHMCQRCALSYSVSFIPQFQS